MGRKYTKADLDEVSRLYDENDVKLTHLTETAYKSEEWKACLKEERRLNELDTTIRKALGIYFTVRKDGTVSAGNFICPVCEHLFNPARRQGRNNIYCSDWCENWAREDADIKAEEEKQKAEEVAKMPEIPIAKLEVSLENVTVS